MTELVYNFRIPHMVDQAQRYENGSDRICLVSPLPEHCLALGPDLILGRPGRLLSIVPVGARARNLLVLIAYASSFAWLFNSLCLCVLSLGVPYHLSMSPNLGLVLSNGIVCYAVSIAPVLEGACCVRQAFDCFSNFWPDRQLCPDLAVHM